MGSARAAALFGKVVTLLRKFPPAGVDAAFVDRVADKYRDVLIETIEEGLRARELAAAPLVEAPELLTPAKRTKANLAAMAVIAKLLRGDSADAAEKAILGAYSGWGGLSIRDVTTWPEGVPIPEKQGLVHEYYTPTRLWAEVARNLEPYRAELKKPTGVVRALEPSAGIGRALRAFAGWGADIQWTAVEFSKVSAVLLKALFVAAEVVQGPFEGFVAEQPGRRFDLVISNPPYGGRDMKAMDPDPVSELKRAYLYFVRRTLGLLRGGGIGVYLIPTGLLTSKVALFQRQREAILKQNHLMAAFRLPSQPPPGGTVQDVVYESFVTDLWFVRSRGGELPAVAASDVGILEGLYFDEHPDHVLGKVVGLDEEWEPTQPKPRRGYQIEGVFKHLPAWTERPMVIANLQPVKAKKALKAKGGIDREVREAGAPLPPVLEGAVNLGMRADRYLAAVATADPAAAQGWNELRTDLLAWRKENGDPAASAGLRALVADRITGAERFLALWQGGKLVEALEVEPVIEARYPGEWSLPAVTDWLYRQRGSLTVGQLSAFWKETSKVALAKSEIAERLLGAGWCLDGEAWDELLPDEVYYTGLLWPRHDRAEARKDEDPVARRQWKRLREVIGFRAAPDIIKELTPVDSWLPTEILMAWAKEAVHSNGVRLLRQDGLLQIEGFPYETLNNTDKKRTPGLTEELLTFIGWANLDKALWQPEREKVRGALEPITEARDKYTKRTIELFQRWFDLNPAWARALEAAYNRRCRGYVAPTYSCDPIANPRYKGMVLWDYQNQGARRLLANRSGLLAFDVGLGKTITGITTLAKARQEGWARRPVILVPNSIVWKWYRDIGKALPDYRVLVVGSDRRIAKSGPRKGRLIASPDSPEERAAKWTQFQAGGADVVLLTYSMLRRTKIDPAFVERYVDHTVALRRAIAMSVGEAEGGKEEGERKTEAVSERKEADLEMRIRGWVEDVLAPGKKEVYDPGIDWHQLGVDFLMVDEAQNFKNLFASQREGTAKKDTKRAWALDFRCASVREHASGGGIVLLSATPAKNNPVEFYSMIHYLHPDAWQQVGIDNHEAFLQRFGDYAKRRVPNASGTNLIEREVLVKFKEGNLDELRSVMYRWAEFKVAEEVGLKIPCATRRNHTVRPTKAMGIALAELYDELAKIEEEIAEKKKKVRGNSAKAMAIRRALDMKKMGISYRIYLTYLHQALPGIGDDVAAIAAANPNDAPKLVACAKEVLATARKVCSTGGAALSTETRTPSGSCGTNGPTDTPCGPVPAKRPKNAEPLCLDCSHIIFCDNIAVHYWMRDLLVAGGIPKERIAILNGWEAADIEYRAQVVEGYNGVGYPEDEEYAPPIYDVVIANAVAYEGMDLQRRTCAIHHLDTPWDPATLQQRNGRGVRQGNQFGDVELHYYFVEGSNEIHRIDRIERKRNWMASLVAAQRRTTNTTSEHELTDEEMEDRALKHASPEARERIQEARRKQKERDAAIARHAAQELANRDLRAIRELFRRADREQRDPERAAEFRKSAEAKLAGLATYETSLWDFDWHSRARLVRDCDAFVPRVGPPLCPGEKITLDGQLLEVQRLGESAPPDPSRRGHKNRRKKELPKVPGIWLRPWGELELRQPNTWYGEDRWLLPDNAEIVVGVPPVEEEEDPDALVDAAGSDGDDEETDDGADVRYVQLDVAWPEEPLTDKAIGESYAGYLGYGTVTLTAWNFAERGAWFGLAALRQDAWWPAVKAQFDRATLQAGQRIKDRIPVLDARGELVILSMDTTIRSLAPATTRAGTSQQGWEILPSTNEGWAQFIERAKKALVAEKYTWTVLDEAATTWWARRMPKAAAVTLDVRAEAAK